MVEQFIYMLPLLILLCGVIFFAFKNFSAEATPQCFKLSRLILLASFIMQVIFYNRPMLANLSSANHLTLIFICWLYGAAAINLYLARKWFNGIKQSGASFCSAIIFAVISGCLLIISKNIFLTGGAIILLFFITYRILKENDDGNLLMQHRASYAKMILFFSLMLGMAAWIIYKQSGVSDYVSLKNFFENHQGNILSYISVCIFIVSIIFFVGMAPLHYWFATASAKMSLPVLIYFLLVPPILGLISLSRLNMLMLILFNDNLQIFYAGISLISVFIGALGACSSSNIRQLLVYTLILQQGIVYLVLQHFSLEAVQTAIVYLLVCWLAVTGICIGLFCFKIKGEYLSHFEQFANASYQKPYAAAVMTLLLFSLLGLPPLSGALSLFAVLNELAVHNHFYSLVYVLVMLLVLSYAYLQFVQKIYFDSSRYNFDRTGFDLYIVLLLIMVVMAFVVLQPHYLIGNSWLSEIFYG